ncbi:MAG: O-antigen ligase family protein [Planctomycetes bacterium]|nr:O-antigen ligase family protein [Planctomycetota bacterium]
MVSDPEALRATASDPVGEFHARVSQLPLRDPRRIGLLLIHLGVLIAMPAVCLGVFPANLGLGIGFAGCLIARAPLLQLPGFRVALVLAGWIAVSCLAGTLGGRVERPFHGLGLMYTWAMAYPVMIALADRRVFIIGGALLAGAVIVAAEVSVAQFVIGLGEDAPLRVDASGPRFLMAEGFFSVHLTHGFVMCVALLALQSARRRWSQHAWIGRISVAAAAVALVLSRARLAYVGIAAGIWAAIASRGRRYVVPAVAVAVAVVLVLGGMMWRFEPDRFEEMLRGENGRWAIWRASAAIAIESPVLGAGSPEACKERYRQIYPSVVPDVPTEFPEGAPHAHNSFLSIAATYGCPALILYLLLLGAWMRAAFRARAECLDCWSLVCSVVAATATAGMFENLAGHSIPAYATFLALGVAFALRYHQQTDSADAVKIPDRVSV